MMCKTSDIHCKMKHNNFNIIVKNAKFVLGLNNYKTKLVCQIMMNTDKPCNLVENESILIKGYRG